MLGLSYRDGEPLQLLPVESPAMLSVSAYREMRPRAGLFYSGMYRMKLTSLMLPQAKFLLSAPGLPPQLQLIQPTQ